jgi:hypothetical protein
MAAGRTHPSRKIHNTLLLDLLLLLDLGDTLPLLRKTGSLPLPHGLVLDTPGLHLVLEVLGSDLLGLGLVNVLHEDSLVLESVTLGFGV